MSACWNSRTLERPNRRTLFSHPRASVLPWFVLFGALLAGCAERGAPPAAARTAAPDVPLVWPKPPDEPRIRYLKAIAGPQDVGAGRSLGARIVGVLTGRPEDWLIRPTSVVERNDTLVIADPGAQAIYLLHVAERRYVKVTMAGEEPLVSPVGLAVDRRGRLFVADSALARVFIYALDGQYLGVLDRGALTRPTGLAFDEAREQLLVVDTLGHRVVAFDPQGVQVGGFGAHSESDGELNFPTSIAVGRDGLRYVTDTMNRRVQIFDAAGTFRAKFGRPGDGSGDFARPKGIAVDRAGHVFVVDALFDAVQIFDGTGALLLAFGERGTGAGQFWLPSGIHVTERGRIYIADSYNQRVQVFEMVGSNAIMNAE